MAGLLNIGITGLNAAQAGLNTTAHNITNANTAGYTRQTVVQTTNDPLFTGVGFFGQGTQIAGVKREYSQFLENQVLSADNRLSEYTAYYDQISQIDNLLADSTAGLSPTLQGFFDGVQEVASNPTSVPARQSMISSAQSLVSSFKSLDTRLTEIRQGVEGDIKSSVDQINTYANQIAELNQRIVIAQSAGPDVPANDLLDQRNQLITELNTLIKTTTVAQDDGTVNVFIGSGQSLVLGQDATKLAAVPDPSDPTRVAVAIQAPGGNNIYLPEELLNGGSLGGLLSFRSGALDHAQNQLGLVALNLAETFNAQHRLGVDLDGVLGGDFFNTPSPVTRPALTDLPVTVSDASLLTAADYKLVDDGGSLNLIDAGTGATLASGLTLGAQNTVAGLTIDLSNYTSTAAFDAAAPNGLLIQPTRFAARDIAVAITDPRKVAAASPVGVEAPTANEGTGKVSDITVSNITGMDSSGDRIPDFATLTLSFDATANAFTLSGGSGTVKSYDPATGTWSGTADLSYAPATDAAGKTFRYTDPSGYQFSFTVSGAPQTGDVFNFAPTADLSTNPASLGIADNRNAVLLGALQTTKTMLASAGGQPTATFASAYAQLVSSIGNQTQQAQVGQQSQQTLLSQAQDARDSLSGVNLDEEAANLLRYQQAYQAVAKVMTTAQTLFNSLLSIAQ